MILVDHQNTPPSHFRSYTTFEHSSGNFRLARLFFDTAGGLHGPTQKPVLHGDNGATLKATTVLAMLHWLGVKPSYSRPWVSDGNAFVRWYNHDHTHSGIRYVSPAQRHAGEDIAILAARHALYEEARERHPRRWSGLTRNWSPIAVVTLNPERDAVVNTALDPSTEKRKSA